MGHIMSTQYQHVDTVSSDSEGSRYSRPLLKIASRWRSCCRSSGDMTMFCDDVAFDGVPVSPSVTANVED